MTVTSTSGYTTYTNRCYKCGKPYLYVGDPVGDLRDYLCTCPPEPVIVPSVFGVVPQGWECPRCHKVWSPLVAFCDCFSGGLVQSLKDNAEVYRAMADGDATGGGGDVASDDSELRLIVPTASEVVIRVEPLP